MNYPEIDALGRTKQSRQYVAGVANPFAFAYEYNLGGTMTSVTYPSGRVVAYDTNTANRVSTVRLATGGNYWSGLAYSAGGALKSATVGATALIWNRDRLHGRTTGQVIATDGKPPLPVGG